MGMPIDNVPKDNDYNSVIDEKVKSVRESLQVPHRSAIYEEKDVVDKSTIKNAKTRGEKLGHMPTSAIGATNTIGNADYEQQKNQYKYIETVTLEEAAWEIYYQYRKQILSDKTRSAQSVCIWGAPGIGKSNIKKRVQEIMKENGFNFTRWIEISGRGNPDDLYMHVRRTIEYIDMKGKQRKEDAIALQNICNLPMYNSNNLLPEEEEILNYYANGGRKEINEKGELKEKTPAQGGVIFIDEFSRSNEYMMKVLMTLISDQTIGGGIVLGDKWIVVAAANTKSQMKGLSHVDEFFLDPAQQSRLKNIMVEPDVKGWLDHYRDASTLKYTNNITGEETTFDNIEPEILDFIEKNQDWFFQLQFYDTHQEEFTNQYYDKAIPRNWEQASLDIRARIIIYNERNKGKNSKIKSLTDFYRLKSSAGYEIGKSIIAQILRLDVGPNAANAFIDYMDGVQKFSDLDAKKVWETGSCSFKNVPYNKDCKNYIETEIIPKLVNNNPGFENLSDYSESRIVDAVSVDKLKNIAKYLNDLIEDYCDKKKSSVASMKTQIWRYFEDYLLKKCANFNCLKGEMQDNICALDRFDEITNVLKTTLRDYLNSLKPTLYKDNEINYFNAITELDKYLNSIKIMN